MTKKYTVVLSIVCIAAALHAEVISVNFYKQNTPKVNTSLFRGVVTDWAWDNLNPNDAGTYDFADVDGSSLDVQTTASAGMCGSDNQWRGAAGFAGIQSGKGSDTVVVLKEIPYEKYYVIVYVCGWGSPYKGKITDGITTKYFDFLSVTPKEMVESNDVDPSDGFDPGSYVVFGSESEPLTGSSLTLTASKISGAVAIGGFQVVSLE